MSKKLTKEEFIKRAREIHGDKYDYSKVEYVDCKSKVIIICPEHGEFEQIPDSHLHGSGCPKCGGTSKSNTEEFIEKAKEIHGDKYDYSKVDYKGNKSKVIIICPEHGEFEQIPDSHLRECGCPTCSNKRKGESRRSSIEEFIKRAREVHGDKYDYSKVDYINSKTNITIICPIHGEFKQTPEHHLMGNECPKCSGRYMDTEYFIEKAKEIHGDKYDYSKVSYVDSHTKVTIICPEHGEFEQTPHNHLCKKGCPRCISYKLEDDIENLLTTNSILFEPQKTFDWLQNKSNLYLDFYLPDYDVAIECQGIQHFQSVGYFGGDESFDKRLQNDNLKRDLCEEHGIRVIYYSDLGIDYPYEVIEDLDEILKIIKNI